MGPAAEALGPGVMLGGKYAIERPLGAGGMGTVYAAENVEIGRRVAIKVLNAALAGDPGLVARFRKEARAAALIRHPGIVDVLDLGTAADGAPFIVMELLEGETLGALLGRGERLDPARLVEIVAPALDALAAAHRAGVVHRDLKPDNLFLCREGAVPVKLVDFGISKFGLAEGVGATQSGMVMGTPLYMAPEQIRSAKDAGPPADLYSMGAICYHALAGRPPFGGETFSEVVARVITEPLPPLRVARPGLPEPLANLVERLLAKAPADRPADAAAAAASLRATVAGGTADDAARASQRPRHSLAMPRSRRLTRAVAGGVGLVLALAVGGGLLARRSMRARDRFEPAPVSAAAAAPVVTPPAPPPAPAPSPPQAAVQPEAPRPAPSHKAPSAHREPHVVVATAAAPEAEAHVPVVEVKTDGLLQPRNQARFAAANPPKGARLRYENGAAAFQAGDYDVAITEFEQAYAINPRPVFLYDLAQACRLAGHPGQALRYYRLYLRNLPEAANRAEVEAKIAALEGQVGR